MNSKISCEQARDLLPSYIDGVCGEESSQLINEHLQTCDACRAQAAAMKEPIEIREDTSESDLLKKVSATWKNDQRNAFQIGVIVTMLCALFINIVFYYAIGVPVIGNQPIAEQLYLIPISHFSAIVGLGIILTRKLKNRKKEK